MAAAPDFNIVSPIDYATHGYPHEIWQRLRAEDPVHYVENGEGVPFWALTKHADITAVSKQPTLFVSGERLIINDGPERPRDGSFPPTLIDLDPPKHQLYRDIMKGRFTPRGLKKIHADIEAIGKEIVDALVERSDEGECDFVDEVAAPLPIAVIAWLLGVPRDDWKLLFDWTNRTIGAGDPEYQVEGEDQQQTGHKAMIELFQYFSQLIEERKNKPQDDLISLFAHAEIEGKALPIIDVLAFCFIIVVAGNETTRNGTSGGMLAFIQHQDQMRKLQADMSLLKDAVEEIVRWSSPIIHFARTATADTEIQGRKIKKGDALGLFYPSANRDEDIFEDPYSFRIDRHPNRHIGFGIGEHFCLGAHVARLEMQVAFKYLIPRIEEIELVGPVSRLHSALVGGVKHLPVRFRLRG